MIVRITQKGINNAIINNKKYIERFVYMKTSNIGYIMSNIDLAPVCSNLSVDKY